MFKNDDTTTMGLKIGATIVAVCCALAVLLAFGVGYWVHG